MNARPYLKRAFKLLGEHKPFVALSLSFSLDVSLPFLGCDLRSVNQTFRRHRKDRLEHGVDHDGIFL